ncbi:MAG TPA: ROK family protein, partial [Gaiellaceae bacterium]|nr:ROK family protein [Gaiellaceae bacterium]
MAGRVVGVDVGGTKILAGVVDAEGTVQHRRERLTELQTQERLVEELGAAVEDVLDDSIEAIGFGLPSRIDQQTGRVEGSVNIPLADVPLRDLMRERFGL